MNKLKNVAKYMLPLAFIAGAILLLDGKIQFNSITLQGLPSPTPTVQPRLVIATETIPGITKTRSQPTPIATLTAQTINTPQPTLATTPSPTPMPQNTLSPATHEAFVKTVVVQMKINKEREYLTQMQLHFAQFRTVTDQASELQTDPQIAFDERWRMSLLADHDKVSQSLADIEKSKPPARLAGIQRLIRQQGERLHQGIHALDPEGNLNRTSSYNQARTYFAQASQLAERTTSELKKLELSS